MGISNNFLPDRTQQISNYIETILSGGGSIGLAGTVFSFIMILSLITAFSRVVNTIWAASGKNNFILSFLKFIAVIVIVPLFIIITFTLQNFISIQKALGIFNKLLANGNPGASWSVIQIRFTKLFSLILNWFLLTFLYAFIPHSRVKVGHAFLAGIFAGTSWYLIRLGLNLYIRLIPQINILYGSLAFFPIFLIWVYCSWIIILFGVEMNYSLHLLKQ